MSCPRLRLPFERSVRTFDPDQVTSRAGGAPEALPYEVGLEPGDPERDLAVCLLTSGKPFVAPGLLRWLGVTRTIARRCPEDWGH